MDSLDYKKWKTANVTLRGIRQLGEKNSAGAMLGDGLYTAPLSNKAFAKLFGNVYFVVNAKPKKPKIFNTLNDWEIWFYNSLVYRYSQKKGKDFPDVRDFNSETTVKDEMIKLGYDGIVIKGREMVNYMPAKNIMYFDNENELKNYYENNIAHKKYKNGGKSLSKTPAPIKERIYGSKKNPSGSSESGKSARAIEFGENTLDAIKNKIEEYNKEHPDKKITLEIAKAVVRRGMGAYSATHRPTIKGGKPNSRVAWGLARLNAFLYKAVKGKSKSGKYSQDNDLLDELGIKHSNLEMGGSVKKEVVFPNTNSAYDKQAQKFILNFLKRNIVKDLVKHADENGNYEIYVVYDKSYPNDSKIYITDSIEKAYNFSLNLDVMELNIVKVKKDYVRLVYDYYNGDLFGGYTGEKYDEKGKLKEEVKESAIADIKNHFNRNWYNDGGEVGLELAETFMLAPNGKPSNLTPEQWHLVRTPEFKAWFGDWEKLAMAKLKDAAMDEVTLANLSKDVSKVIDENGEPLVVYHGSESDHTTFDANKIGLTDRGWYGYGYYFSPTTQMSDYYGKSKPYFIKIKNPFNTNKENPLYLGGKDVTQDYISKGYDGASKTLDVNKLYHEYCVFFPFSKNIKLADGSNTTFDGSNPDIRYERGGEIDYRENAHNFFKKELNIKSDVVLVQSQSKLETDLSMIQGGVGFKSNNKFIIKIDKNDTKWSFIRTLAHELVHIKQMEDGRLVYSNGKISFDGEIMTYEQYKEMYHSEKMPKFEEEAFDMSRELQNKYYQYEINNPDIRFGMGGGVKTDFNDYENDGFRKAMLSLWNDFTNGSISNYLAIENENYVLNDQDGLMVIFRNKDLGDFTKVEIEYIANWFNTYLDVNKKPFISKYIDTFYVEANRIIIKLKPEIMYAKGGEILLAPNGKPSNLTPEQWHLVRTPAFKAWFGDWENDPENASKVVDENGEPLIVWHGGEVNNAFDKNKIGKNDEGWYGYGFYFTEDKSFADAWGESKPYFIKIKNPFDIIQKGISYDNPFYNNSKIETDKKIKEGFDGSFFKLSKPNEYVVYYEFVNQIKLADGTNTTFDSCNPDIRFGMGGKVQNSDKNKIYSDWKELVNMSNIELQKYYDSDEGKTSGLSAKEASKLKIKRGRDSAKWILKMKKINMRDWTEEMWEWAKRQIRFIKRMRGVKGRLYDKKGNKTPKYKALLIWGHNPEKYNKGGEVASKNEIELTLYRVILSTDDSIYIITETADKQEAERDYESVYVDMHYTGKKEVDVILEEYTNTYKWVCSDDDSDISDYPIEDYYEDSDYYELLNEGTYELIDLKKELTYELKKEKEQEELKEKLENEITSHLIDICIDYKYAAFLGSTFYGLYPYRDGYIVIRRADHFFKISNVQLGKDAIWDSIENMPQHTVYKNLYGFISINLLDENSNDRKGYRNDFREWKYGNPKSNLVQYIDIDVSSINEYEIKNWRQELHDLINEMKTEIDDALNKNLYDDEFAKGGEIKEKPVNDELVYSFENYLIKKYNIDLTLSIRKNYTERADYDLLLSKIEVPKKERGSGIGTKVMDEVIEFCDQNNLRLILTPDTSFGGTSVARLNKFYKKFGLVDNRGNKKDYSIRETMYRYPAKAKHQNKNIVNLYEHNSVKSAIDVLEKGYGGAVNEAIKVESEHKNLYNKIKKQLAFKGVKMPLTEKQFFAEIAKEHIGENPNYYNLLKRYVEKEKKGNGGAILLAPNGRKSNLTPKQYELVRTPEFKAWFGDWESLAQSKLNDPAIDDITLENISKNISKVVDENGEPLVVYHGTDIDFNEFVSGKEGGIFFTEYKRIAEGFAAHIKNGKFRKEINFDTKIYECFLNIKKMKTIDYGNKSNVSGIKSDITKLKKAGNDGLLIKNAMDFGGRNNQYIAWYSNQIKLADGTNTTFDSNNPDIRYTNGGTVYQSVGIEGYLVGKSRNPYIGREVEIKTDKPNVRIFKTPDNSDYRFIYYANGRAVSVLHIDAKYNKIMNAYTIERFRNKGLGTKLYNIVLLYFPKIEFSKNLSESGKIFKNKVQK